MQGEMDIKPLLHQLHGSAGVRIQLTIVQRCQVDISKLLDPRDQIRPPLPIPLLDETTRLVGTDGRYGIGNAPPQRRHHPDE
jgi:hypothetical protein